MVDFTLTEEQQDIREMARDFVEKEIRPVAWDYNRDATSPQQIIEKAHAVALCDGVGRSRGRHARTLRRSRQPSQRL